MTGQTDVKDWKYDFLIEITSWQKYDDNTASTCPGVGSGPDWIFLEFRINQKMQTVLWIEVKLPCWSGWDNPPNNSFKCF